MKKIVMGVLATLAALAFSISLPSPEASESRTDLNSSTIRLSAVGAQVGQMTPSTTGASIDRIEVYVHINDRYPSLLRVSQAELNQKAGFLEATNYACSGSMLPALSCEDTTYLVDARDTSVTLAVGDIVTYRIDDELESCINLPGWESGDLIEHRIIAIDEDQYQLKGDNNSLPDPCWVPRANIIDFVVALRRPIDLNAISEEHMRQIVGLYFSQPLSAAAGKQMVAETVFQYEIGGAQ
ncbi:MAG: hypothetical protein OYI31_07425 [Chloroflexota bacterium]|nr:hypothetical protein [Chloroflexota bacterium]MDE2942337.1 hypothetical protein [Chloroflexota bacterium]MDE3268258.1 hypothetical protein [Chloroflexota bacterium]